LRFDGMELHNLGNSKEGIEADILYTSSAGQLGQGDIVFYNAVLEKYGNVEIKWEDKDAIVEGVRYKWDTNMVVNNDEAWEEFLDRQGLITGGCWDDFAQKVANKEVDPKLCEESLTKDLKVFVWEGVLTDHTDGVVMALAHDKAEALKLIEKECYYCVDEIKDIEPRIMDAPEAIVLWGGG